MAAAAAIHAVPPLTFLTEEEQLFQQSVRQFSREQLAPHARGMDEEEKFRPDLLLKLFDLGLMGIDVKEELGGQDGTFFQSILAIEEIAKVDPGVAVIVDVQNTLVNNAVARWATPEQKQLYLSRLASSVLGAYALSEAHSGSDAFALTTSATADGDHYRLTGRKLWITNAAEAGLFLVFATVDPAAGYKGITVFRDRARHSGLRRRQERRQARHPGFLHLRACARRIAVLRKEYILGEVGKGYKIAIETLNEGRIGIGAQCSASPRARSDHALRYAKERQQFGKPIGEFQGVQFELAEMAVKVEAARLLVYNAARLRDAGQPFVTEAAMAKYYASRDCGGSGFQGHRSAGRRRLHEGLSGGKAISGCENRANLRGHQQHAAHDHRQGLARSRALRTSPERRVEILYLLWIIESLVGRLEASQPPPSASTSSTLEVRRRVSRSTAVL